MMHIDTKPIDLKLTTPFRIARGVQTVASNAIVQINHNGYTGYGEAAPDEFYGEDVEAVLAFGARFAGNLGNDPFASADVKNQLDKIIPLNPAAETAVDIALYDLGVKVLALPLYQLM